MNLRRAVVAVLAVACALVVPLQASADAAPSGGFDDWSCRPSADRPRPVVLLHGLGGDPQQNWSYVGPRLAEAGFCAFASPYSPPEGGSWPFYGLAPIDDAAADVAAFIDDVLAATGATQVDVVGHSEGGVLSLYVPKVLGYGPAVGHVVALAPPTHGTSFLGLVTLGRLTGLMPLADLVLRAGGCPACADLVVGGPAIERLNDGPITQPGVTYTIIATRFDALVRNEEYDPPTDTSFVREPGVRNLYVQDECPLDPVGHIGLAFDPGVFDLIVRGLDPSAPAPRCSVGLPF